MFQYKSPVLIQVRGVIMTLHNPNLEWGLKSAQYKGIRPFEISHSWQSSSPI
jgi:hypothetical protein